MYPSVTTPGRRSVTVPAVASEAKRRTGWGAALRAAIAGVRVAMAASGEGAGIVGFGLTGGAATGSGIEPPPPADDVDMGEDGPKPIVEDPSKSLKELLEDLDPEDFGKYKM